MFDFGLRLQQLRISHNLSQAALGKKVKRSKSAICAYEANMVLPSIDVLTQLAVIFNVSLDYLVGIDKNEMVSLSGLTEAQQTLIHLLIEELKSGQNSFPGLTDKQQDILNRVMSEFYKKHT